MQQFYPAINLTSKKSFVNPIKISFLLVILFSASALFAQVTPTRVKGPTERTCDRKTPSASQIESLKVKLLQQSQGRGNGDVVTSAICAPGNIMLDGGYEATDPGTLFNPFWSAGSTNFGTPLCNAGNCGTGGGTAVPRNGNFWSWFGGITGAETGTLQQTVVIPVAATINLNFYLRIGSVSAPFDATLKVKVDGITQVTYTEPPVAEADYSLKTVDLSAFADGVAHIIRFEYSQSAASGNSNFNLDDVSFDITACGPCTPASITTDPASTVACAGTNVDFTAAAAGAGVFYQWQVNSGSGFVNLADIPPYSGTKTPVLHINAAPFALNTFQYRLAANSVCGDATSAAATLTLNQTLHTNVIGSSSVLCSPGSITITGTASGTSTGNYTHTLTGAGTITQNASTGVNDANASFSVSAIPAGTQTYVLTSVGNVGCPVTSNVTITVNATPVITLSQTPVPLCAGQIQQIGISVTPPTPQTFSQGSTIVVPGGQPVTTSGTSNPYPSQITISGLPTTGVTVKSVKLSNVNHTFPDDMDIVLVSPTGQAVILMSDAGGDPDLAGLDYTFSDAAAAGLADASLNLSGTYKPTNFGATDNFVAPGPGSLTQATPTLATFTGNPNGDWKLYVVDDVSGNYGFIGNWNIVFDTPTPVTFSPVAGLFTDAAATVPYTGTPVIGSIYSKPTVASTIYTATATVAGCTGTANATVVLNQLPAITAQPTATQTACPGTNVVLTVTATGSGLTYQWRKGGVNLVNGVQASGSSVSGATTNTLTLSAVVAPDAGNYDVVIAGTCIPGVTSAVGAVIIASAPTITTQPANAPTCAGGTATFTVVAAGTPTPTLFQWQVSTTAVPAFTNIVGGNTATLAIPNVTAAMDGNKYRVIITNTCGQSVTSNGAATLTVTATTPPTITALPATICLSDAPIALVGSPVGGSFSGIGVSGFNFIPAVTAVGNFTLTYSYTNALGCTATATTIAKVSDCPERARLLRDKAVIVYPIPNNGNFSFRVNSTLYNYLNLKVYNTSGGLLSTRNYSGLVYGQVVPVDLTNLPSGSYMLRFFYDDGARTSEKVIPIVIMRN